MTAGGRKNAPLQVRFDDAGRRAIESAAGAAGKPVAAFIRDAALRDAGRADLADGGTQPLASLAVFCVEMEDRESWHFVASEDLHNAMQIVELAFAPRVSSGGQPVTSLGGTPLQKVLLHTRQPGILLSQGRLRHRVGDRVVALGRSEVPKDLAGLVGLVVATGVTPGNEIDVEWPGIGPKPAAAFDVREVEEPYQVQPEGKLVREGRRFLVADREIATGTHLLAMMGFELQSGWLRGTVQLPQDARKLPQLEVGVPGLPEVVTLVPIQIGTMCRFTHS